MAWSQGNPRTLPGVNAKCRVVSSGSHPVKVTILSIQLSCTLVIAAVLAMLLLAPPGCSPPRDSRGRILRDPKQRARFQARHPCPSTGEPTGSCPGWEVDHVCPLSCCGKDDPSNMQWQTVEAAKATDNVERKGG